jgi:hypothetical protein
VKIISAFPPNYATLCAAFPIRGRPGIIFSYGDAIYNPSGNPLSEALKAHEWVHIYRQNGEPAAWWQRYIADIDFRRDEEIKAHCVEAAHILATATNRNGRRAGLMDLADRLSSPLYGGMMSKRDALALLRDAYPIDLRRPL